MTEDGHTHPAGQGLSDEEMLAQVAGQTSNDLRAQDVFEREHDGATTGEAIAEADADDIRDARGPSSP